MARASFALVFLFGTSFCLERVAWEDEPFQPVPAEGGKSPKSNGAKETHGFENNFKATFAAAAAVHLGNAVCYDSITKPDFRKSVEEADVSAITRWMLECHKEISKTRDPGQSVRPIVVTAESLSSNGTAHPIVWGAESELVTPKRWKSYTEWLREAYPTGGRGESELAKCSVDVYYGPVLVVNRGVNTNKVPDDKVPRESIRVVWEVMERNLSVAVVVKEEQFEWKANKWIKGRFTMPKDAGGTKP